MAKERGGAQDECANFLNRAGGSRKNKDGISCPRCHAVVLPTTDTGAADYIAGINGEVLAVEVKGGIERLSFNQITLEQWTWLEEFERMWGGTAWFWIQLGQRIGHKLYPRQVFLITRSTLAGLRIDANRLGVDNLPLNALAANTRISTREDKFYAEYRCSGYALQFHRGQWFVGGEHLFAGLYNPRQGSTTRALLPREELDQEYSASD